MSKYKTPFPADAEASKALENRTSKYRLPFKKDEPVQDLQATLNNLSQQNISLQSEVRLPKLAVSTDLTRHALPRKHKNNMSIHEEVNMAVKSDREELHQNYHDNGPARIEPRIEPQDNKRSQREVGESERSKEESQARPKFSLLHRKKRRYLSSASKYADDEEPDHTELSEDEPAPKREKAREGELPVIGESKFPTEKEDSDEDLKNWQNLSREIQKYQEIKEKEHLLKNKGRKSSKRRKSLSRKLHRLEGGEVEAFQSEFKNSISRDGADHKRSLSYAENPAFFELIKQQSHSPKSHLKATLEEREMRESLNLMEKLKEIIAIRNEKLSKAKLRLPLEFYVSSYEQIKAINPFFRKLNQMEGSIMLSIGRLTMYEAGRSIYGEGDLAREIYIIIYGKVLLSNRYRTLRKFALTGETLGEEELFEDEKSYVERLKEHARPNLHRYDARALAKSCLLKVQLAKYYKMSCELSRLGYKQQFTLIDNLLRINFINKQTNLHYNQRQRIQTDTAAKPITATKHKPNGNHGAFFY